ncbi:MAG: glycosyltransferase family 1 protein [Pseudomonadota bacterium]
MRIAIVTDAWHPQVNGVVRTLSAVSAELQQQGHEVLVIGPDRFASLPCPTYPEIRLALAGSGRVGTLIAAFGADAIHIATEGPLGLAARHWCRRREIAFTTAYHTHFPDYVAARTGISADRIWCYVRWFHTPATAVLSATPTLDTELAARGVGHTRRWGRGIDPTLFHPDGPRDAVLAALPGPVQLYVGRVAVEKNLPAFLDCPGPGTKVVVGDGPALAALSTRYPDAHFVGARHGAALAQAYRAADVLVFPSKTDTFGLVMIEALACGTPVAAFPVPGPRDVLTSAVGALGDYLPVAILAAASRDRAACATYGAGFSWAESARQFLGALAPARRQLIAA